MKVWAVFNEVLCKRFMIYLHGTRDRKSHLQIQYPMMITSLCHVSSLQHHYFIHLEVGLHQIYPAPGYLYITSVPQCQYQLQIPVSATMFLGKTEKHWRTTTIDVEMLDLNSGSDSFSSSATALQFITEFLILHRKDITSHPWNVTWRYKPKFQISWDAV